MTPPAAHQVFAAAFEYAAIGMAVLDAQGRLQRVNPALCEMLGYSAAELCRIGLPALVHPDDLAEEQASRQALAGGLVPRDRRELRYRHQGGRTVWGSLTRILVRDELGQPAGFVDQVQDLTERRRAEKEIVLLNNLLEQRIRRRTAELEESNEDLRDFAYSLAHDLRGPLASIDGFSAQLEGLVGQHAQGRAAHYLHRVRAGVQQMAQLTDGLLALADVARTELQHESVDLSTIAAAILDRMREHQPHRDVQVEVLPTPPAKGDPRLLADVLENLLGNAWKFTGRTAGARIAFASRMQADGHCCYHVRDNGAGFDPAYASKLFTPFQRLHTSAEFEGTGIGLAMVRKIVSRHGGRIWAESRPGEGAAFFFTLGGAGAVAAPAADSGY